MLPPNIGGRCATLVAPLLLGLIAGCGEPAGISSPLPPSDGSAPPVLPKEQMGTDGFPKSSNPSYDTAHGARPPR